MSTIQLLPTSQLRASALNPRQDLGDLDELGADLLTGQISALIVYPSAEVEGDYEVLDGHRRLAAARKVDLLELRCEIRSAPERAEALATMITAGRTGKHLTSTEIAAGVQGLLDLGMDVETIKSRTRLSADQVKALRALTTAPEKVREVADSGQGDISGALALAEAREEFADDPEELAKIENYTEQFGTPGWTLGHARARRTAGRFRALVDRAGMKPTPDKYRNVGLPVGFESWLEECSEWLELDPAMAVEQLHGLASEKVTYYISEDTARVRFTPAQPKASADKPEPTPEEIAASEAHKAAETALLDANKAREEFILAKFQEKDPVAPIGPGSGHALLVDLAMAKIVGYRNVAGTPRMLELLGLKMTRDPDQWESLVITPARKALNGKTWRWLAAALAEAEHGPTREGIRKLKNWEDSWYQPRIDAYVGWVEATLGYREGDPLAAVRAYVGRDAETTETAECGECGQTVSTDVDSWTGVCEACSE